MLQPLQFFWNEVLYRPSLNLIIFLYSILWNNLGLAIIVIAIIFRLLILPFIKKQTEMTKKMAALGPQLKELQKKYKNNPEKLSMEQLKLYRKVGYNPLGCLTSFLPQIFSVISSWKGYSYCFSTSSSICRCSPKARPN